METNWQIPITSLDPQDSSTPERIFRARWFHWDGLDPNIYTVKVADVVCLSWMDKIIAPFNRYSHVVFIESEGKSKFVYIKKGESVTAVLARIEECAKSARESLEYDQECLRLEESITSDGYQLCQWDIDPSQAQIVEPDKCHSYAPKGKVYLSFQKDGIYLFWKTKGSDPTALKGVGPFECKREAYQWIVNWRGANGQVVYSRQG